jgi:hypothetical protein
VDTGRTSVEVCMPTLNFQLANCHVSIALQHVHNALCALKNGHCHHHGRVDTPDVHIHLLRSITVTIDIAPWQTGPWHTRHRDMQCSSCEKKRTCMESSRHNAHAFPHANTFHSLGHVMHCMHSSDGLTSLTCRLNSSLCCTRQVGCSCRARDAPHHLLDRSGCGRWV